MALLKKWEVLYANLKHLKFYIVMYIILQRQVSLSLTCWGQGVGEKDGRMKSQI